MTRRKRGRVIRGIGTSRSNKKKKTLTNETGSEVGVFGTAQPESTTCATD